MQHIHLNNGKTFLFAAISEGVTEWRIHVLKSVWLLTWGNGNGYIKLPSGNWQIISKASEATEVQAREIVKAVRKDFYIGYKEYVNDDGCYVTAFESLNSLLHSHIFLPETTLILQKI